MYDSSLIKPKSVVRVIIHVLEQYYILYCEFLKHSYIKIKIIANFI